MQQRLELGAAVALFVLLVATMIFGVWLFLT